ncbi:MAG: acyl-CoA thioesterase [bacterium]|nr:acyl-CoA thioesterase [bacterium]
MAGEQTTNYDSFETSIFEVVFPSMVNQYGTLFGGIALQWMDRAAWICSTRFARKTMVTIASDRVVFKKAVRQGSMVELKGMVKKVGRTSVTIQVELYSESPLTGKRELATHGEFVMVALDADGHPTPIKDSVGK